MPSPPKIVSNEAPLKTGDVTVIDYSNMKIPKCQGDNSKDETRDSTPSRPPWTTFTGILEARRDSVVGQRILQMDAKVKTVNKPVIELNSDGESIKKNEEWVRGIWFAPSNWNEIPNF